MGDSALAVNGLVLSFVLPMRMSLLELPAEVGKRGSSKKETMALFLASGFEANLEKRSVEEVAFIIPTPGRTSLESVPAAFLFKACSASSIEGGKSS